MTVCFFNKKQRTRVNQLKEILISINFSLFIFITFIKKMEKKRVSYEKSQENLLNINA